MSITALPGSAASTCCFDVFKHLCGGKRVLHIGCADWPITNPATSLHLALEPVCVQLDGFDVHEEALAQLAPLTKGWLFSNFAEITDPYDIVLVPEVMEHVPNVSIFLAQLEELDASCYFMSVPDAFQCRSRHFDYLPQSQTFVEVVHPDHNVWYTPYTFMNTIKKYTRFNVDRSGSSMASRCSLCFPSQRKTGRSEAFDPLFSKHL